MYDSIPMPHADDRSAVLETYREQGYVILEGVLGSDEIEALCARIQSYLDIERPGRNNFEGTRTQRVYSLVGRGRVFEDTVLHPQILDLLDELLLPGYLLTASQAIVVGPGETPQPIHFDDTFYTLPRPRPEVSVSTIWALDDFTADNGATEIIPGSHAWGDEQVARVFRGDPDAPTDPELEARMHPVEMPAGSCVLFAGTLLHRGGANTTERPRRAFSHQYCQPWARTQENYSLTIPRERVRRMPERLQEMLGYSILPPFMGQVAGRHPKKSLEPGWVTSLETDDALIAEKTEGRGPDSSDA